MAAYLGINVAVEKHLLWIAKTAILAPVPQPWVELFDEEGIPYYHNPETAEVSRKHPLDGHFLSLIVEERQKAAALVQ